VGVRVGLKIVGATVFSMKIVDATGLVSIKIVGAIGLDGKLWAQQVWSALWALEWAWHLWALEWAWHIGR